MPAAAVPSEACERAELRVADRRRNRPAAEPVSFGRRVLLPGRNDTGAGGAPVTLPDRDGGEPLAAGEGTAAVEAGAARGGAGGGSLGVAFGRDGPGVRATPWLAAETTAAAVQCSDQRRARERGSGGRIVARQ